jgi:hypothetical protein
MLRSNNRYLKESKPILNQMMKSPLKLIIRDFKWAVNLRGSPHLRMLSHPNLLEATNMSLIKIKLLYSKSSVSNNSNQLRARRVRTFQKIKAQLVRMRMTDLTLR